MKRIALLLTLVATAAAAQGAYDETALKAFHAEREKVLLADDGWFTVAGLHFLNPGDNKFGSDPLNDIVLEYGDVPKQAGVITMNGTAVTINGHFSKLPPGTHAIHVHNVGTCTAPDFTSAGPHFNPGGKQHGTSNPNGAHAGDLPNFEVDAKGIGDVSFAVPDMTLRDGPNSLFHAGGTALVIHAAPDDNKTDPSGNAGARTACGVIEKAK